MVAAPTWSQLRASGAPTFHFQQTLELKLQARYMICRAAAHPPKSICGHAIPSTLRVRSSYLQQAGCSSIASNAGLVCVAHDYLACTAPVCLQVLLFERGRSRVFDIQGRAWRARATTGQQRARRSAPAARRWPGGACACAWTSRRRWRRRPRITGLWARREPWCVLNAWLNLPGKAGVSTIAQCGRSLSQSSITRMLRCVSSSVATFHGLFPLAVFGCLALALLSCDASCECVRR